MVCSSDSATVMRDQALDYVTKVQVVAQVGLSELTCSVLSFGTSLLRDSGLYLPLPQAGFHQSVELNV